MQPGVTELRAADGPRLLSDAMLPELLIRITGGACDACMVTHTLIGTGSFWKHSESVVDMAACDGELVAVNPHLLGNVK